MAAQQQTPYEIFAAELSYVRYQDRNDYSAADIQGMDQATLKKAYKKLAMKWHPDRDPSDEAKTRMNNINHANNIIGDADKRAAYDAGRIDDNGDEKYGAAVKTETTYEDLFGTFGTYDKKTERSNRKHGAARSSGASTARQKPNLDVKFKLAISFTEAACGTEKTVKLKNTQERFSVTIKPGIEEGDQVRIHGKGLAADGRTGDALASIVIKPHEFFIRQGNDIHMTLPVTFCEAALGETIDVPTVRGPNPLSLPQGVEQGTTLVMEGCGINGGNQIVTIETQMPDPVDDELAQALKDWAKRHPQNPRAKMTL